MKTEAIRYCIQAQYGKVDYEAARKEMTDIEYKISELTALNESMQTDARKNTETIRTQAAEIARLTEKVRYAYVQIEALERAK